MNKLLISAALFCLANCVGDETISGYAPVGQSFWLQTMNGQAVDAQASIRFDQGGTVSGVGPCNAFTAGVTVPYPWFELGPIRATRAACPELETENAYFSALARMSIAETSGSVLILSNDSGEELVFALAQEG